MGGTLQVRSVDGNGSTFSLKLDLREDRTPASIREIEQLELGGLRVYVADDDMHSRDELLLSLAGIGISGATGMPFANGTVCCALAVPSIASRTQPARHATRESSEVVIVLAPAVLDLPRARQARRGRE